MSIQAQEVQDKRVISTDWANVFTNLDNYKILDKLYKNDTVIVVGKGNKYRTKIAYEVDGVTKLGFITSSAIYKHLRFRKESSSPKSPKYRGKKVSSFDAEGYHSVTYRINNTYRTYVNGKLDHTYTSY